MKKPAPDSDVPGIDQLLASQQITLTPMERKVKAAQIVARVEEMHLEFGFAILNPAQSQAHEMAPGASLAVRREHYLVGRLTLDRIEEAQWVANIVPRSVPVRNSAAKRGRGHPVGEIDRAVMD